MKSNFKFFKNSSSLPVDKFFDNVLYDKKIGYYNLQHPFGKKGDFITSPKISYLFSEMIAIWMISFWEKIGKPKNFNIIELGPGDGSLIKILIKVFKKFPQFNKCKKIYLIERSDLMKKLQKKIINSKNVRWVNDISQIKNGPNIFFGNEFFDAITIKQFKKLGNHLYEKHFELKKYNIKETYKKATNQDSQTINSFKTFKNLKFIELPKKGLKILKKIVKKILNTSGCILLIDYGYLEPNNKNTLQSVFKHKKNELLKNLGKADVTAHVNFALLNEFFVKNGLKVKKIINQNEFLNKLGIQERAEIISKKMNFNEKVDLYFRLKRLTSSKSMGGLFKVILAESVNKNSIRK